MIDPLCGVLHWGDIATAREILSCRVLRAAYDARTAHVTPQADLCLGALMAGSGASKKRDTQFHPIPHAIKRCFAWMSEEGSFCLHGSNLVMTQKPLEEPPFGPPKPLKNHRKSHVSGHRNYMKLPRKHWRNHVLGQQTHHHTLRLATNHRFETRSETRSKWDMEVDSKLTHGILDLELEV